MYAEGNEQNCLHVSYLQFYYVDTRLYLYFWNKSLTLTVNVENTFSTIAYTHRFIFTPNTVHRVTVLNSIN